MTSDMNISGFSHIKRGRPKKVTQLEWLRFQVSLKDSIDYTSPIIRELYTQYNNETFTEDFIMMIKKIIKLLAIPYRFRHLPILSIFEESIKQQMVTKLELTYFGMTLKNVDLENSSLTIEELVKVNLFISKRFFETDSRTMIFLRSSLSQEIKEFDIKVDRFSQANPPSIREINKFYSELQGGRQNELNYTYYVDEILRNTTPYIKHKFKASLKKKRRISEGIENEKLGSGGFAEKDLEGLSIFDELTELVPAGNDLDRYYSGDSDIQVKWTTEDDWLMYPEDL